MNQAISSDFKYLVIRKRCDMEHSVLLKAFKNVRDTIECAVRFTSHDKICMLDILNRADTWLNSLMVADNTAYSILFTSGETCMWGKNYYDPCSIMNFYFYKEDPRLNIEHEADIIEISTKDITDSKPKKLTTEEEHLAGNSCGPYDFKGNNCDGWHSPDSESESESESVHGCSGWDGDSTRCNCGNRRVYWNDKGEAESD